MISHRHDRSRPILFRRMSMNLSELIYNSLFVHRTRRQLLGLEATEG
jgi:GTP-sensing pleiotropic transcriptional regulator CodY